ncbi:hypothetical protein MycrhDRAFT_5472 [Mycolicibacterium rhodesiae JS60]|nr:hypothetical protein MycrhDRAFT_5472 [Mycolicibacterium rhodesiae JS60]
MCKASHEPGGPQRCSGDTRAKASRSQAEVSALEHREADIVSRTQDSASSSPAWGPHIGPPPFAPPNGPDFEQWYAEQRATDPQYRREHAYDHFYNIATDPTGAPGYSGSDPSADQSADRERERRFRNDRERDGMTLGYSFGSISSYVDAVEPHYEGWSAAKMNDPFGQREGAPLPGAVDYRTVAGWPGSWVPAGQRWDAAANRPRPLLAGELPDPLSP